MIRPTIQQLRVLHTVGKLSSITKASKQLNLTQPAISLSIKKLEQIYDTKLTETIHKKVYLTQSGKLIADSYLELDNTLTRLDNNLSGLSHELHGELTVSMVSSAKFFIPYVLANFVKQHPNIKPVLQITDRQAVINAVENNLCDLAIFSEIPKGLSVMAKPFAENPQVLIASPKNSITQLKKVSRAHLAKQRFITRESGSSIRDCLIDLLAKYDIDNDFAMTLNSTEAIKQLVIANLGISLVPLIGVEKELKQQQLCLIDLAGLPIMKHWHCVYPKSKLLSPVAKNFAEYLAKKALTLNQTHD